MKKHDSKVIRLMYASNRLMRKRRDKKTFFSFVNL